MQSRNLIALVLLFCSLEVVAEDPKHTAKNPSPAMETACFSSIIIFRRMPIPPKMNRNQNQHPVRVLLRKRTIPFNMMLRNFLRLKESNFLTVAFATYEVKSGFLVVRNTPDNLDLVDEIVRSGPTFPPPSRKLSCRLWSTHYLKTKARWNYIPSPGQISNSFRQNQSSCWIASPRSARPAKAGSLRATSLIRQQR